MNDVNGFGGTVIQVVVHPLSSPRFVAYRFGGTVIQVIVHLEMLTIPSTLVSEVR